MISHLISISEQIVNSIVVLQEFGNAEGIGVDFIFPLVYPVVYMRGEVL